jgi:hypothetical protein
MTRMANTNLQLQTKNQTQLSESLGLRLQFSCAKGATWMGKSLVMPRAASLSTIRGEIPSLATSSASSPAAAPASETVPGHGAGMVALNPRGLGEAWNARRLGGSSGCGAGVRHGSGAAGGGEMSAASRALRGCTGDKEAANARRSSEFMATVQMRGGGGGVGRYS